jgi:site-specific DNA-adenine methylase
MDKRLKTPLRYPGGKSKAMTKMAPYFPPKNIVKHYREPFLGGGSVAFWMTQNYDLESVWVNDLYWPLYNFWINLRDRGEELSNALAETKRNYDTPDKAVVLFNLAKKELSDKNVTDFEKAINFWIVNKCSFSGLTESSSFSKMASNGNFTLRGIEDLKKYSKLMKGWKITNLSYEEMLKDADENTFIYLDPPYEISSNLYGKKGNMHKGFDHDLFAKRCNEFMLPNIAISYNADQSVTDRFTDWTQNVFPLTYTMRSNSANYRKNQPKRMELLLTNYD